MLLANAAAGLNAVPSSAEIRREALQNLERWLEDDRYRSFRPQLIGLIERENWQLLLDSFYRVIPFGTGGRRGPVGIGPNRFNHESVRSSVQGHVDYLRRQFPGESLRVVVAFDVRVFHDLRGVYDRARPNPLLGTSSRDFARLACGIYAANGVEVYTVPGDDGFYLSTPELSFVIRHRQAHGGLNLSASHNHPDDNGMKFYLDTGGQPIPPVDEDLATVVEAVSEIQEWDFEAGRAAGLVTWLEPADHTAYLDSNLRLSLDGTARRARIVYSPLNGCGRSTVGELLQRAGFDLHLVEAQAAADGSFASVKFRLPNPEVPESMELATQLARELEADVALASDPDADRLGAVVPDGGSWRFLSGNELAVMLLAYVLEAKSQAGEIPSDAFVLKTAVTTDLLTQMARSHGVTMLGDLLVGFKYVGAALDEIEKSGRFRSSRAGLDGFLFATEESNGFLINSNLRDKDAAGAALLLSELAARLRREGKQLGEYLDEVYRRYGYAAGAAYSVVAEGIEGHEKISRMMAGLRQDRPSSVCGLKLVSMDDHWDEARFGEVVSETDRRARNFLQFRYDQGLLVAVRPSGTEPKIKLYLEQVFEPREDWTGEGFKTARAAMEAAARNHMLDFVGQLLARIELHLPRSALVLSPAITLEARIDFAQKFLPELEAQFEADSSADLAAWVDRRLQPYGNDPRYLVRSGIEEYLRTAKLRDADRGQVRAIFFL